MDEELMNQIETAAFVGYVMLKENMTKEQALDKMADLCSLTQCALGLGHLPVNQSKESKWTT